MRRFLIAFLLASLLTLTPFSAFAADEPLFFTESEAQEEHVAEHGIHPVIWVFVGIGAASLAACGWMVFVNREKKPQNGKEKAP